MSLDAAYRDHERYLWGLCYRMTGSAADADDLVHDAFARAMERPPADTSQPWRPWLVRVAINLARDHLRRRKRRAYVGTWLPEPVELAGEPPGYEPPDTAARYDLMESVSYAFLVALEALTPQQRAVLLLRDAYDYTVRETADALGMSEANVKTTLHRARRAMAGYDAAAAPQAALVDASRHALQQFLLAVGAQDTAALEQLLAADVRGLSDGGSEYRAARVPILGRAKLITFYTKLARVRGAPARMELKLFNGTPGVYCEMPHALPGEAARFVIIPRVDAGGRIVELYSVLAAAKLASVTA